MKDMKRSGLTEDGLWQVEKTQITWPETNYDDADIYN